MLRTSEFWVLGHVVPGNLRIAGLLQHERILTRRLKNRVTYFQAPRALPSLAWIVIELRVVLDLLRWMEPTVVEERGTKADSKRGASWLELVKSRCRWMKKLQKTFQRPSVKKTACFERRTSAKLSRHPSVEQALAIIIGGLGSSSS